MHDQLNPAGYYRQFIKRFHTRHDGRSWMEARPVNISTDCFHAADASSIVRIGTSMYTCGIRLEVAPPSPHSPDIGFVRTDIDVSARSSPLIKPGAQKRDESAHLACMDLQRVLEEAIDLKQLCIIEGKWAYVVCVHIHCLNHDSAIIDGALKAAIAALETLKLPVLEAGGDNDELVLCDDQAAIPLTLFKEPRAHSFSLFDKQLMADPSQWEMERSQAHLSIIIDGRDKKMISSRKLGSSKLSVERHLECLEWARSH
eukprot:Partr_v1_DN27769_c0_g1_i1_m67825 putative Exosome complex